MNNNIFYIEGNFIDNSIKFIEKYPNAIVVAEDSLFKDVIEKKISQKIYLIDGLSVYIANSLPIIDELSRNILIADILEKINCDFISIAEAIKIIDKFANYFDENLSDIYYDGSVEYLLYKEWSCALARLNLQDSCFFIKSLFVNLDCIRGIAENIIFINFQEANKLLKQFYSAILNYSNCFLLAHKDLML